MRMVDGHCAALRVHGTSGHPVCGAYETRPQACRDLARGSSACLGEIESKHDRPRLALARGLLLLMVAGASLLLATTSACGGSQAKPNEPAVVIPDAGPDASAAVPVERPFASTPLEAQTMIQAAIDARMKTLWKCVEDYRMRTGDPHRALTLNVGIDQEGHLFGVTAADPKHPDLEPALKECVLSTLRGAPFPRSHTGVITVRQVFQDAPTVR
jgi:hypothetical protein